MKPFDEYSVKTVKRINPGGVYVGIGVSVLFRGNNDNN